MKFALKCDVSGNVRTGKEISVVIGNREYILSPDEKGKLTSIKIVLKTANPENYSSRIEPGEGKSKSRIIIKTDPEDYRVLVSEFQELESVLSFTTRGALKKIDWNLGELQYIPEDDHEKENFGIASLKVSQLYPDPFAVLDENSFRDIIIKKCHYTRLIVPEAFFREGSNEFQSGRYINAFYNFYFILEDFYGQAKTRNKDISEAFKNSVQFVEILKNVFNSHINNHERHRNNIKQFCQQEKIGYNILGMVELLQRVRGNLHHFSSKSSKHHGTPFTHNEYESMAFFTMGLAVNAIALKMVELSQQIKH